MKKLFTIFSFFFLSIVYCVLFTASCLAQNLVPNFSFEQYDTCPYNGDQVRFATNWSSIYSTNPNHTPDYFNSCSPSKYFSVPKNVGGFQYASDGNAYCGFFSYGSREFLGAELITPMNIGTTYYVSFKVNMAFDDSTFSNYGATNKLGIRFFTYQCDSLNPAPINNFAHIYTDSIIKDTLNWITIVGSFIADSTYKYFVIGNFFDDTNTDTLLVYQNVWNSSTQVSFAYYYIDDIYVSNNPQAVPENCIDNNIVVYPNPTTNIIFIKFNLSIMDIKMYNSVIGNEVKIKIVPYDIDTYCINLSNQTEGIYLLRIQIKDKTLTRKILVAKTTN